MSSIGILHNFGYSTFAKYCINKLCLSELCPRLELSLVVLDLNSLKNNLPLKLCLKKFKVIIVKVQGMNKFSC